MHATEFRRFGAGVGVVVGLLALAAGAQGQTQYSIGNPSNEQQYMLELINRARANGGAEATRLGLSGLQEGPPNYNGEVWTIANANQPLSWNPQLQTAAQNHANNLNNADQFFLGGSPHTFGGSTPDQRIAATGYVKATYNGPTTTSGFFPGAENVAIAESQGSGPYSGAKLISAILQAHNDLFTDLTVPGRGHRNTTMLGFWREAGIGISVGTDNQNNPGQPGGPWDSFYVVQNFGTQSGGTPFVTGVVYNDANGNNFYDPGEGIGGVRVDVNGSNFFAITSASGGYSVPVPGNGAYTATFSGSGVATTQRTTTVSGLLNAKVDYLAAAVGAPARFGNISTRMNVGTGDNVLIGGFIVTGTQPKRVIIRSLGPSYNLAGKLADPILELHGPGGLIATNDNWRTGGQEQAIIDSTVPPTNDLEAALIATLPANRTAYTAIVRGVGGGTGIGSVEIYDLDPAADSTLANISSRGFVQTGNDVMIGGFIITGTTNKKVIVRSLGPSLAVANKLADPTLELYNKDGVLLATNDNWRTGGQQQEIIDSTVPPPNDLEAAIVATLPPTAHTAIVRGKNGSLGVATVEAYTLD